MRAESVMLQIYTCECYFELTNLHRPQDSTLNHIQPRLVSINRPVCEG